MPAVWPNTSAPPCLGGLRLLWGAALRRHDLGEGALEGLAAFVGASLAGRLFEASDLIGFLLSHSLAPEAG